MKQCVPRCKHSPLRLYKTDLLMLCKAKVAVSCAIRTYLLTYSIVQSPSWEANWFAASQEIPAFHGTPRFITTLTSVRHQSLSWASPIQSIYPHPTSWRSILILSTHLSLGLPSGLLPSGFPSKTLYNPLSSPIRATCPAHLILLVRSVQNTNAMWEPCRISEC